MNRVLPIILTISIILNSFGYYIAFKGVQYSVKKEIKRKLKNNVPEDELFIIRLTKSDISKGKNGFKYIEANKEFTYNNKMFDIVRRETKGDSVIFHCINDVQEENILANIDFLVKENFCKSPATKKKASNSIKLIIKHALPKSDIEFPSNCLSKLLSEKYFSTIFPIFIDVISPPPEG